MGLTATAELHNRPTLKAQATFIKVQVKAGEGSLDKATVASLHGNIGNSEYALFVTLGTFAKAAQAFCKDKGNLRLIDSGELIVLVLERYDQLDTKYKGLLPSHPGDCRRGRGGVSR